MKKLWTRLSTALRGARAPSRPGGLARDTRGAVYVEFLAVFFPILTMFLSLVQFAFLQTASIVVQHAAMRSARVVGTTIYDDPAFYGGDGQGTASANRLAPARDAARVALSALGDPSSATIAVNKGSYTRNEMITLTVEYPYTCRVPLGRIAVCGVSSKKVLRSEAIMPSQGAEFTY